jgi:hypothetical protein
MERREAVYMRYDLKVFTRLLRREEESEKRYDRGHFTLWSPRPGCLPSDVP